METMGKKLTQEEILLLKRIAKVYAKTELKKQSAEVDDKELLQLAELIKKKGLQEYFECLVKDYKEDILNRKK